MICLRSIGNEGSAGYTGSGASSIGAGEDVGATVTEAAAIVKTEVGGSGIGRGICSDVC